MTVFASELDTRNVTTATELREVLKARGWTVNVSVFRGIHQRRHLDFCPEHKPNPEG
jgi:hypothetical protein